MPAARLPFVYLATLAGPSIAGLALTSLVSGKKGFRDMLARLAACRVGARWYAVALLTVPVLTTLALVRLSLTSPAFQPAITTLTNPIVLVVSGIMVGLVVGFFEEIGWTGLALPELRKGHGVLTPGLLMGLLWGIWHFPLFAGSANASGAIPPGLYVGVLLFSFLPPYRMLMVWLHDHTKSLPLVILMHAPLVASQFVLIPAGLSGESLVTFDLVFAAALWMLVAAVMVATRRKLARGESVPEPTPTLGGTAGLRSLAS